MTQDERKVIELALEALETAESCIDGYHGDAYLLIDTSITAMKELLAQPEQEYGVVAGVGKGVEIPACVKYYYIEPKLPPQPEKLDQDEVDIRSRLYQRIHELETQLAQPEQEPVIKTVWVVGGKTWQQICATQEDVHKLISDMGMNTPSLYPSMSEVPLLSYTTPALRTWVGLTLDEIEWCFADAEDDKVLAVINIERMLSEKNT